ncbi:MAG: hypothetical protein ACODAE_01045 [Gemmatimonadota bacterium]
MSEHATVPEELRYPIGRVEIAPELSRAGTPRAMTAPHEPPRAPGLVNNPATLARAVRRSIGTGRAPYRTSTRR